MYLSIVGIISLKFGFVTRTSNLLYFFLLIKHVMGFRQFMLRGFEKVKGEWNLVCLAYNLKRLHTIRVNYYELRRKLKPKI